MSSWFRSVQAAAVALAASAALPAFAMTRCPVEPVKPAGFVALGVGVLVLALCAGLAAPLLTWRRSHALRPGLRALWLAAACAVMLGLWLAGLLVWLGAFVLPC